MQTRTNPPLHPTGRSWFRCRAGRAAATTGPGAPRYLSPAGRRAGRYSSPEATGAWGPLAPGRDVGGRGRKSRGPTRVVTQDGPDVTDAYSRALGRSCGRSPRGCGGAILKARARRAGRTAFTTGSLSLARPGEGVGRPSRLMASDRLQEDSGEAGVSNASRIIIRPSRRNRGEHEESSHRFWLSASRRRAGDSAAGAARPEVRSTCTDRTLARSRSTPEAGFMLWTHGRPGNAQVDVIKNYLVGRKPRERQQPAADLAGSPRRHGQGNVT